eukprot:5412503-Amphidinium_carterae.1
MGIHRCAHLSSILVYTDAPGTLGPASLQPSRASALPLNSTLPPCVRFIWRVTARRTMQASGTLATEPPH